MFSFIFILFDVRFFLCFVIILRFILLFLEFLTEEVDCFWQVEYCVRFYAAADCLAWFSQYVWAFFIRGNGEESGNEEIFQFGSLNTDQPPRSILLNIFHRIF